MKISITRLVFLFITGTKFVDPYRIIWTIKKCSTTMIQEKIITWYRTRWLEILEELYLIKNVLWGCIFLILDQQERSILSSIDLRTLSKEIPGGAFELLEKKIKLCSKFLMQNFFLVASCFHYDLFNESYQVSRWRRFGFGKMQAREFRFGAKESKRGYGGRW